MMRRKTYLLLSLICLSVISFWSCEPVFGTYLYGTDDSSLYKINPADSSHTRVGGMSIGIDGLSYNFSDGFLYGTDDSSLYKINPADSSHTRMGGMSIPIDGLAYVPEPATLLLLGLGGLGLRRKLRAK